MAGYRLSPLAEIDLEEIGAFTIQTFGLSQADQYLAQLEDCFILVASRPQIARRCDSIRPGLRRFERGSHVIFFCEEPGGILISRILHKRMLPAGEIFGETE